MNLFGIHIPFIIVALLAIGFAYWYTFMRGDKKKIKDKDLEQSRKDAEYYENQVSITQSKKTIEDSKKARK